MKILFINGPNLNILGRRLRSVYGDMTLEGIEEIIKKESDKFEIEIVAFQSNSEGEIIDFIQENSSDANGIIINPGAFTHYSYALRDALDDAGLPAVEVHISNIYSREEWRAKSVIAPVAKAQISGLGWYGYIAALRALIIELTGRSLE